MNSSTEKAWDFSGIELTGTSADAGTTSSSAKDKLSPCGAGLVILSLTGIDDTRLDSVLAIDASGIEVADVIEVAAFWLGLFEANTPTGVRWFWVVFSLDFVIRFDCLGLDTIRRCWGKFWGCTGCCTPLLGKYRTTEPSALLMYTGWRDGAAVSRPWYPFCG